MTLLEDIRAISREAAWQLEKADCRSDQDIRSLTQNDLQELLPGISNFRIRKKIYETIHKKRPVQAVLNELKGFIPDDFQIDAFTSSGALHDYLQMLKALKSEVTHVQEFLDAHIDLLEKFSQRGHSQREDTEPNKVKHVPAAPSSVNTNHFEHNLHLQKEQAPSMPNQCQCNFMPQATKPKLQATLRYRVSVSGNTLNRHLDVLEKIKGTYPQSLHLQEAIRNEDSQITIVFCPVVSRVGTDVETALQPIQDNKPVILVMMHHSHTGHNHTSAVHVLHDNVVLIVSVFFHETVPGLLPCPQNVEAIDKIKVKLRSFITKTANTF
ncbi:uncharacterized protein LOC110154440 isoform X2 [Boleophthalmus pectinirostris]|uniref:uncharacterized protein LOC110154440 isoform X2 n=1 Tax=Boleophthalmus pectinirostris TaxID=150288 RepID=UPI000A1C1FBE|nr:uncharacterized protein LOC110154440 isoform X2 [Boleophthalmus pectinirostris]